MSRIVDDNREHRGDKGAFSGSAVAVLALASCLLACGGGDEAAAGKPSGERKVEPAPETPKDAEGGPFAGYDFAAAQRRLSGAWVVPGAQPGRREAWSIDGDRVQTFDGEGERSYGFSLYSPCQIALTDIDAGETVYRPFAFVGEQLHVGVAASAGVVVGGGGERDGGTTIVCAGGRVLVLDAEGRCRAWSEMFDDWKSEAADCRIEGEGEARRFVVGDERLRITGAAVVGEALLADVAEAKADFSQAKAAVAGTP